MSKKVKVHATIDLDELADIVAAKVIRAVLGDIRMAAIEAVEGLTVQLPASSIDGHQPTDVLSFDEAVAYLRVGRSTLFRLVAEGTIPSFKVGKSRKFRRDDLVDYVRLRVTEDATP